MRYVVKAAALLVLAFVGPWSASAQDNETAYATIAQASTTRHIVPRYQTLASTGTALAGAAETYCADKDAAAFFALEQAFRDYWIAWAGIRHIQFGPVTYLDRAFRIQFWPDTRNRIGKQLQRTLSAADGAALSPETFASTSVAIQGLPALERLLAEGQQGFQGADGSFRCELTVAIARNLALIAADIVADWNPDTGFAHYVAEAGTGDGPYSESYQVPVDLLQSLLGEIEASRDIRIGRPMGSSVRTARPKLAEAWRSGLSREILAESVAGIEDLYLNGGFDAALRSAGHGELADRIGHTFKQVSGDIATLGMPLYQAYEDETGRRKLETVRTGLKELAGMTGTDLAVALEISPGFNARDGD